MLERRQHIQTGRTTVISYVTHYRENYHLSKARPSCEKQPPAPRNPQTHGTKSNGQHNKYNKFPKPHSLQFFSIEL